MWNGDDLVVVAVLVAAMLVTKLMVWGYQASGRAPMDLKVTSGQYDLVNWLTVLIAYAAQTAIVYVAQVHIHGQPFGELGFDADVVGGLILGTLGGFVVFSLPKWIAYGAAAEARVRSTWPRDATPLYALGILAMLIVGLVLNSYIEELVFRAYPIEQLTDTSMSAVLIVLASALLFSLVHHIIEPFNARVFLMRFLVGVIFGELYVLTGSIWLLIGVHTGVNAAGLIYTGQWRIGGILHLEHDRDAWEMRLNWGLFAVLILGLGALLNI